MDVNAHSFIGPDDNGRAVSLGDVVLDPAANEASAIKITQFVQDLTVVAGAVHGGHDACVDVNNRANDVHVVIDEAIPTGEFAATVKGGAQDVILTIKKLSARGKTCDLITDDWSDQSHDPTSGIVYDVMPADGKPVRVIAMKAKPALAPGSGPYVFLFPWPWLNPAWLGYPCGFIFDTLRRWGLFRAASNDA